MSDKTKPEPVSGRGANPNARQGIARPLPVPSSRVIRETALNALRRGWWLLLLSGLGLRPTHWQLEKERRGEEREEKTGNSYSYP